MKKLNILALGSLSLTFLFSACASPDPFASMQNGTCAKIQSKLVSDHIKNQISALTKGNFEEAYSYAADSFQNSVDLESFEYIIKSQYQVLINNSQIKFKECFINNGEITQLIEASSAKEQLTLNYRLTIIENRLGIIAANSVDQSSTLTT